uniref:Mab-21-like HhH/H2TH-like domain-containing protein n=1 Tax=Branchiostoma floridae TaxID=7739 RepID=C3YLM2_BRAFL|eukprot:XP_002602779.1 hypothetical protein BRAFLDRAFT_93725 [Branchiostoma floridae]
MNESEEAFVLLVALSIVIGIPVFVVWLIYKAWKWLTGYENENTRRHPGYRHRFNAEPERSTRVREEVASRIPEWQMERDYLNDYRRNVFPKRCLAGDKNINPTKMLDWFYGLVQRGINKVNIKERNGLSIDVDLVLCIQLDQQTYYVAKPYKDYAEEPPDWSLTCDPAMLWRQSFSVTETRTLASIDGAHGCRRDCLRVLKSVFRREPGLSKFTSFHLKTVLLRMFEEEDQWQSSNMGDRFFDLLLRIEACLEDRRLPHFYLPELNLLDGIRHVTIENVRRRVTQLIDNEHERNRILYICL